MKTTIKSVLRNEFSRKDGKCMGQIVLNLIKSDQTKVAKEIVPKLRRNSKYNTI